MGSSVPSRYQLGVSLLSFGVARVFGVGGHVKRDIYLDYNGSSPLDPRVLDEIIGAMRLGVGNASSLHRLGRLQAARVDQARGQVANLVGARANGVVFTAGATEANNLVLQGLVSTAGAGRHRILISAVEHASVKATAAWLSDRSLTKSEVVPVTEAGAVDLEALDRLLGDDVSVVSIMAANSETGVLNDLEAISGLVHSRGALFHSDATQYAGRLPLDMASVGVDAVSISAHKICGPTGVGALVTTGTTGRRLRPIIHGGGHERGLRSGSLNVAGIVGFGTACEFAVREQRDEVIRFALFRDRLVTGLKDHLAGVEENGDAGNRLPNTANLRFVDADGEAVMVNLDSVAVSSGSACSAGAIEPSPVLLAMGVDRTAADESLRFSLGRFTTAEEIEEAVTRTAGAVEHVRVLNGST